MAPRTDQPRDGPAPDGPLLATASLLDLATLAFPFEGLPRASVASTAFAMVALPFLVRAIRPAAPGTKGWRLSSLGGAAVRRHPQAA